MPSHTQNRRRYREELLSSVMKCWVDSKQIGWKESTRIRYQNTITLYLLPQFGHRRVAGIGRDEVESFVIQLLMGQGPSGKTLAEKTVSFILSVLKQIFQYAKDELDIPVADLKSISVRQRTKPLRVFSLAEQQVLTQFLRQRGRTSDIGILLALYTGLRIGELCALTWKDISLDEQTLYVRHTMQRLQSLEDREKKTYVQISAPKSACSVRQIPLPAELSQLLEERKCEPDCYFLTGSRDFYVEPRTMENRFKAVCQACNITGATFHTCRHTFATRCIELGFDVKSLSEILGHASVGITMNRYVHPSMEYKRENMKRLSAIWEKDVSQSKTL